MLIYLLLEEIASQPFGVTFSNTTYHGTLGRKLATFAEKDSGNWIPSRDIEKYI